MAENLFSDIGAPEAANPFGDIVPGGGGQPARITVRPPSIVGGPERARASLDALEAYRQIVNESMGAMREGVGEIAGGAGQVISPSQATRPEVVPRPISERLQGVSEILGGVLKAGGGAVGYTTAPFMAPVRAVVSQPLENIIGLPREYTEFAAGLAAPVPRIPRVPTRTPAPTTAELGAEASRLYQAPEVTQTIFRPDTRIRLADDVRNELDRLRVSDRAGERVNRVIQGFEERGGIVSAEDIDALRKHINEIEPARDVTGRVTNRPELRAAAIATERIDQFLPTIPQEQTILGNAPAAARTLEEARANISAREGAETINRQQFRAELRAAVANSGMNVSNTMRARIADILVNPALRRGYSQAELAMMDDIVRGTRSENIVRAASNILGGGGGMHTYLAGFTSAGIAPAIGYGLRRLSNVMTERNITRLNETIRTDSPLGRRIGAQLQDWSSIAQAAEANPSPCTIARLTLASRNLSNNLQDAGINISTEGLLGSFVPGAQRQPSE